MTHAIHTPTSNRFFQRLGRALPSNWREEKIYPLLGFAGVKGDLDEWIGKRVALAFFSGLIGFLLALLTYPFWLTGMAHALSIPIEPLIQPIGIGVGIVFFFGVLGTAYIQVHHASERRARMVEEILPDFLLLVAGNIRAGMTSFSAFRGSARREFGPLSEEIQLATSRAMGTESFSDALQDLSTRIRSSVLDETVHFFVQSLRSGGQVARVLENTALDIRKTLELKKELVTSTRMYVLFVGFVVLIATPLLLAVSVQFLSMVTLIQAGTDVSNLQGTSISFLGGKVSISLEFFTFMAYVLLFGNAFLSSLFMGVIGKGKAKLGMIYFPVILVVSIVVFLVSREALAALLTPV